MSRGDAEHGGDGGGAREETGRQAHVVPGQLRRHECGQQDRHANNDGEDRLRNAVAPDAPEELRSDTVADGKEEHQEEHRFHVRRDRDLQLPDEDADEQHAGHVAQAELPELALADEEPAGQREIDRYLRILTKRFDQPVHHDDLLLSGARDGACAY